MIVASRNRNTKTHPKFEWALSFIIPRKPERPRIKMISTILEKHLQILNKRVVRKHYPLTTALSVLAGVQYVTSLDLTVCHDTLQLDLNASDKESVYKHPNSLPSNKYVSQQLGICVCIYTR